MYRPHNIHQLCLSIFVLLVDHFLSLTFLYDLCNIGLIGKLFSFDFHIHMYHLEKISTKIIRFLVSMAKFTVVENTSSCIRNILNSLKLI